MPYIEQERRGPLGLDDDKYRIPANPGDLNFQLTLIVLRYLKSRGESYQTYAEIEGVLSHVSKELYRRRTAPYEDLKIAQNGDVFP